MKIILCNDTMNFAGTERHLTDLAVGLRAIGVDVTVACPSASMLADRLASFDISVQDVSFRGTRAVRGLQQLIGFLRSDPGTVLHVHNGRCAAFAAVARALAGHGHIVSTQHFIRPANVKRKGVCSYMSSAAHRSIRRQISHQILISDAVKNAALARQEFSADSMTRVHNGMLSPYPQGDVSAVRTSLQMTEQQTLFVSAARLEREKSIEVLLKAHAMMHERGVSGITLMAGDGKQRQEIAEGAEAFASSFKMLGFRKDVIDLIAACDVFVLPSAEEPFGLVLLEAMALGRPVIAVDAGGPREIVVHGETGLLVPREDPTALCAAMVSLTENRPLCESMGQAGRKRFEAYFTAERMAIETLNVYRQVIAESTIDRRRPITETV